MHAPALCWIDVKESKSLKKPFHYHRCFFLSRSQMLLSVHIFIGLFSPQRKMITTRLNLNLFERLQVVIIAITVSTAFYSANCANVNVATSHNPSLQNSIESKVWPEFLFDVVYVNAAGQLANMHLLRCATKHSNTAAKKGGLPFHSIMQVLPFICNTSSLFMWFRR